MLQSRKFRWRGEEEEEEEEEERSMDRKRLAGFGSILRSEWEPTAELMGRGRGYTKIHHVEHAKTHTRIRIETTDFDTTILVPWL